MPEPRIQRPLPRVDTTSARSKGHIYVFVDPFYSVHARIVSKTSEIGEPGPARIAKTFSSRGSCACIFLVRVSFSVSPSAVRVDVAAENDHVRSHVRFVTTSEEEGAEEASYAQRGPLLPVLGGVLPEDRAEHPRDRMNTQLPAYRERSQQLHRSRLP